MRNLYDSLKWTSYLGALLIGASLVSFQVRAQEPAGDRAPAQEPPTTSSGKPEKKKTLSFEDELVEGQTQKPELFYLFQKKNFNYKRLIKLRENFLPEMRKTSEDLQRVRSSN